VAITRQEAWIDRGREGELAMPYYIREIVEEIAIQARKDRRVDKRSGVSQRLPITVLENVTSNAERRALLNQEEPAVARIADVYASLPAITGKLELEYEGEMKGAEVVAVQLIRSAVRQIFQKQFSGIELQPVVEWFEVGGFIKLPDTTSSREALKSLQKIPSLMGSISHFGVDSGSPAPVVVAAAEFLLEGLASMKRISRSEERGYQRGEGPRPEVGIEQMGPAKRRLN
jgi:magnesium chelatase subunit I